MIVLKGIDDSVAIMELAPGADKEEAIRKFRECHPKGFYPEYHEDIELPSSRVFRDAWKLSGNKVIIDEIRAKEIHLSKIKILRDKKLKELDVESLKALSDPDKLLDIETRKQLLRDIPQYYKFDLRDPKWPKELL